MLQFALQARGVEIEGHLLNMSPYLATVLVLVLISRNRSWVRANMPASLGKPFQPSQ
jgi:simple sugar transport system permease protein